jgi:hypothetical protein
LQDAVYQIQQKMMWTVLRPSLKVHYQGTETDPVELLRNKLPVKKRQIENTKEGRVSRVNYFFRVYGEI